MKTLLVGVVLAVATVAVPAQDLKPIVYANGGSSNSVNYISSAATNTFSMACSEVEYLPLVISVKAPGAATSTVRLIGYRSLDSSYYETAAFYDQLVTLNGSTAVVTVTNLAVSGAATIQLKVVNTNASVVVTNMYLATRPKAPKRISVSGSR